MYLFVYMKDRGIEKEQWERERDSISNNEFTPQMTTQPKVDQAEARTWDIHRSHPHRWQRSKALNHCLLPPIMHISRKLQLGLEPGLKSDLI